VKSTHPPLDRKLCQVVGANQNYTSRSGTAYHIQVEDRGPVLDRVTEIEVRRVNLIIYSNYGEVDTRIVHGADTDFEDIRTAEHNRFIETKVKELAEDARRVVEDLETRQIARIKAALREYHQTKSEQAKQEFEGANALYPFLFSKAWQQLKEEHARPQPALAAPPPVEPEAEVEAPPIDVVYPLDAELREQVLEIERMIAQLGKDLRKLKERGTADDILMQTCRKLVLRSKDTLRGRRSDFNVRRLEMTRTSLLKTWKQVRSRLKAAG
jgi:hypothetical protein